MGSLWLSSAEFLPPTKLVKTWVVNDGTREPSSFIECSSSSTSSSIVEPGRTFGATTAIASSHTRQARSMASSSSGDFVRRAVHERRAGNDTLGRHRIREVEQGLRPDAVAHRERPYAAHADRGRLEQRRPVVALGRRPRPRRAALATSKRVIIRGRTNTGSRSGRKEAPPPSRARTATGRRSDGTLDAREVLEVGGRLEEEEIYAGVTHALRETPLPLRVVEHDPESRRATRCETAAVTDMTIYDLRVTVERIEGHPSAVSSRGLLRRCRVEPRADPSGRHFCLRVPAVIPLLPAKQRKLPDEDWLSR
jgi:hypothetical protein